MSGLKVAYWNNDCNKIVNGGTRTNKSIEPIFPELSAEQRLPAFKQFLLAQLSALDPDVVCLSESYNYTNMHGQLVDCIGKQTLFFEAQGFVVHTLPYFQNEPAGFNHLVAVKFGVELLELKPTWMSKSAQPGKGERCVASVTVKKGGQLYVVNVCHMAMDRADRMKSAEVIAALPPRKDAVEVFVGDFNTFSDDGGKDQIDKITAGGLDDVPLLWANGQLVESTFVPFVYNPIVLGSGVPKEFTALVDALPVDESRAERITYFALESAAKGSVLDHIFLRNGKVSDARAILSSVAPNALADLSNDAETRKAVVQAAHERRVPFASDHALISFTVYP